MARFSPLPVLFGCLLAVSLTACSGDAGVDPAAAGDGASASRTGDGAGQGDSGNSGGAAEAAGGARPGAPEPQSGGGARAGGPFDLEAFENIGGPFGGLAASVAGRCGGGACSLGKPVIVSGDPGTVDGGIDQCRVTAITYDPASEVRNGSEFFQAGSAVIAHLDCTSDDGGGGSTDGTSTDGGTADGSPAG